MNRTRGVVQVFICWKKFLDQYKNLLVIICISFARKIIFNKFYNMFALESWFVFNFIYKLSKPHQISVIPIYFPNIVSGVFQLNLYLAAKISQKWTCNLFGSVIFLLEPFNFWRIKKRWLWDSNVSYDFFFHIALRHYFKLSKNFSGFII